MKPVVFLALAAAVAAVPYKRFDNSTDLSLVGFSASVVPTGDSTITVDEYRTVVLGPQVSGDAKAIKAGHTPSVAETSQVPATLTSTVTLYQTLTSDGHITKIPTATQTSTVTSDGGSTVELTTTSTVTKLTTITRDGTTETEAVETGECEARTVTVTVTPAYTTSVPVTAEFTNGDLTTTITSFVKVTATAASKAESSADADAVTEAPASETAAASTAAPVSLAPFQNSTTAANGTYSAPGFARRAYYLY